MHDLLVIALGETLLLGVYRDLELVERIEKQERASEYLPIAYEELSKKYNFTRLIYANGPGSFMGIKISYIFLKTISIVKNIPLFAVDAFCFNDNNPIKAYGKLYFIKEGHNITLKPYEEAFSSSFILPQKIDILEFNSNSLPYYGVDAV